MNDTHSLRQQVVEQVAGLHRLARLQRSLRLGLRAFWFGGVGVLLAWGANALWGWLPNPLTWLLAGLVFALVPVVALVISLTSRANWVWRLDRLLELDEQVSTAWELAQETAEKETQPRDGQEPAKVSDALIQDVLGLLPRVRERMMARGWFLKMDLVASLVVLLLGGVLLAASLLRPYSALLGDPPPAASAPMPDPPLPLEQQAQQARPQEAQPGEEAPGQGDENQEGESAPGESGEQEGGEPSGEPPSQDQGSAANPEAVGEALKQLGRDLSGQAGTYDLGQALEEMDLNGAADALEDLKEQADELSPESRENLAEALAEAAEALEQAGEPSMPEDMRDAAEGLAGEDPSAGEEALGEVAGDLRQMAETMDPSEMAGAGGGAGNGEGGGTGSPEPITRLPGEGGEMDLPLEESPDSGLLNPAPPDAPGEGTASGSLDSSARSGEDAGQTPLLPNTFSWKWRDVVSQYFNH